MITQALFALSLTYLMPTMEVHSEPTPTRAEMVEGDRLSFSVGFDGIESDLRIGTVSIMPGASVNFETDASYSGVEGETAKTETGWIWHAPDTPGHYEMSFEKNDETMIINVFVLTPFRNGKDESLSGYRVGQYSEKPLRNLPQYMAPTGFIDMQPGMEDILVSPNFRLGQFICKQQPGHDPTFLLVQPAMLLKLETLLEAANDKGWEADTFFVMSGFRTPFYNAAIGNKTTSSRHLFGDAADIYIDQDGDGMMDDLNGDGKSTRDDAVELANLAKSLAKTETNWPAGGIGIYGSNAAHGPFVHIDTRGYPARW